MKIEQFENLPIWQEARELSKLIYEATSKPQFKDFSLRDQKRRAVISISSNIAEGFERGSNRELIQFLYIAKGSLGELRSQTYLAYDNGYIDKENFDSIIMKSLKLSKNTNNFIRYLKESPITKSRHKEK